MAVTAAVAASPIPPPKGSKDQVWPLTHFSVSSPEKILDWNPGHTSSEKCLSLLLLPATSLSLSCVLHLGLERSKDTFRCAALRAKDQAHFLKQLTKILIGSFFWTFFSNDLQLRVGKNLSFSKNFLSFWQNFLSFLENYLIL